MTPAQVTYISIIQTHPVGATISHLIFSILGGGITLLTPYFFSTKKDRDQKTIDKKRLDIELQRESNLREEELNDSWRKYKNCIIQIMNNKSKNDALDLSLYEEFTSLKESWFTNLRKLCDSILNGTLSEKSVENTHSEQIREAVQENLIEKSYDLENEFLTAMGTQTPVEFKKSNYKSIFEVYENICKAETRLQA